MKYMVFSLILILLSACSAPQVRMEISGAPNINIDEQDHPLPVVVRVYQLSSTNRFINSTFQDLWKRDLRSLGNTLLSRKEIIVVPGKTIRISFRKHAQARFVAVMAIFRHPGDKGWRAWKDIGNGYISGRLSSSYSISIAGNMIHLN